MRRSPLLPLLARFLIRGHQDPSRSPAPSYRAASSSPHTRTLARLIPRMLGQLPPALVRHVGLAPEGASCPGLRGLALPPPCFPFQVMGYSDV